MKRYYDSYWSADGFNPSGRSKNFLTELFRAYIPEHAVCLEVGCGDGATAGPWLQGHGRAYVGVDISEPAVRRAKSHDLNVALVNDAASLPFADESFDVVLLIEVLEHLFLPNEAVKEAHRVLKRGGILLATVPNVAYWRRRADLALLGRWNPLGDHLSVEKPWRDPHIRFFTPASLGRMIGEADFLIRRLAGHQGSVVRDIPWVGRRLWKGRASRLYRALETRFPALFGQRLHVIARKGS